MNIIELLLPLLLFIPLLGFVFTLLIHRNREKQISEVSTYTAASVFWIHILLLVIWIKNGFKTINLKEITLYRTDGFEFVLDLHYDSLSAVFMFTGTLITFVIVKYSRYYLHREEGYRRFFNTLLFFFLAFCTTVLAGNFETLFVGWEMLGISSFLLIAFYRTRYNAVRNALKVFSVYRIGDVGLLLAMWASHHLWHENITFLKLNNYEIVHHTIVSHSGVGIFIAFCLFVAAAAKSAQLPFSSWLPRAMEGPTPSSAIFYGSLSVHFGVFLLIRTFPFWEEQTSVRWAIGICGIVTTIWAYPMARVQSTIKTQIAYASMAQIGIMFFEVALGLNYLAMIHFMGNAFLRTYQLLVSPSVVAYLIRQKMYAVPTRGFSLGAVYKKWITPLYMWSVYEWKTDYLLNIFAFYPLRWIGRLLNFLRPRNVLYFSLIFIIPSAGLLLLPENIIPLNTRIYIAYLYAFIGWWIIAKSFSEKRFPRLSWVLVIIYHCWMILAVSVNEKFPLQEKIMYFSGVLLFGFVGFAILQQIRKRSKLNFDLKHYHGHHIRYPMQAFVFLVCALAITGFPVSPLFIAQDLVFSHIHETQYLFAFFYASSYVLSGIAVMRIYTHIFLGYNLNDALK
jgi:NADH:ubiquinone oxidoreductase subunit 5 (subunit L)/multisubunit Na+/H+ antiporter MnhA subunit